MMKVLSVALGINVMSGEDAMKNPDAMFTNKGRPTVPNVTKTRRRSRPPRRRAAPPIPLEPEPEPELPRPKADALKEKELGNAAYKAKNFSTSPSSTTTRPSR